MLKCWTMIREKVPELNEPQLPLSRPAAKFFVNRDDVPEYVRNYAARVLKAPNGNP
jgi:hypothetical protein